MLALLSPHKVSVLTELSLLSPLNINFLILFILLQFLLNQIVLFWSYLLLYCATRQKYNSSNYVNDLIKVGLAIPF